MYHTSLFKNVDNIIFCIFLNIKTNIQYKKFNEPIDKSI